MHFFDNKDDVKNEQENGDNSEDCTEQSTVEQKLSELDACQQETAQWKERYLRARADLDNFTRRAEKERLQVSNFAQAEILLDVLSIVDDFDRALEEHQKDSTPEKQDWRAGFELIRASLGKLLGRYGVTPLQEYVSFDPMFHEAIAQVVAEGKTSGAIVAVSQKGYMRNGVLLRPAKVVVAK